MSSKLHGTIQYVNSQAPPEKNYPKSEWAAKGIGRGAWLEAFCSNCSLHMTIENPSLNAGFFHCGYRERCPEKVYEALCELRDQAKPRVPAPNWRSHHKPFFI